MSSPARKNSPKNQAKRRMKEAKRRLQSQKDSRRREPQVTKRVVNGVPTVVFDMGDVVVCDRCGEDWTDSAASGGIVVSGWALCPNCFNGDTSVLSDPSGAFVCPANTSFADHVRNVRRILEGGR